MTITHIVLTGEIGGQKVEHCNNTQKIIDRSVVNIYLVVHKDILN
jgi:hypothetical protein